MSLFQRLFPSWRIMYLMIWTLRSKVRQSDIHQQQNHANFIHLIFLFRKLLVRKNGNIKKVRFLYTIFSLSIFLGENFIFYFTQILSKMCDTRNIKKIRKHRDSQ